MRHAQSIANKTGTYAGGSVNVGLTSYGKTKLKQYARSNTTPFTTLYVSGLIRSIESGEIFLSEQKNTPKIVSDSRLNELDFGDLAGMKYIDFDNEAIYKKFGVESKQGFYTRIKAFYDDIYEKSRHEDVLIIAHAGVGMMLYAIANDIPYEDYNTVPKIESYKIYQLS